MAEAGLTPDRLRQMARHEDRPGRPAGDLAGHALCRAAAPRPAAAGDRGIQAGQALARARPGP